MEPLGEQVAAHEATLAQMHERLGRIERRLDGVDGRLGGMEVRLAAMARRVFYVGGALGVLMTIYKFL